MSPTPAISQTSVWYHQKDSEEHDDHVTNYQSYQHTDGHQENKQAESIEDLMEKDRYQLESNKAIKVNRFWWKRLIF